MTRKWSNWHNNGLNTKMYLLEWYRCLKDPSRETYIRIRPEVEKLLLNILNAMILVLIILLCVYGSKAWTKYQRWQRGPVILDVKVREI